MLAKLQHADVSAVNGKIPVRWQQPVLCLFFFLRESALYSSVCIYYVWSFVKTTRQIHDNISLEQVNLEQA